MDDKGPSQLNVKYDGEMNNKTNTVRNRKQWNPIFRAIFERVYDDASPLSNLKGIPYVIQMIIKYVENYWKMHIQHGKQENVRPYKPRNGEFVVKMDLQKPSRPNKINFPEPSDININMMPFIMAKKFEDTFLPEFLRPYFENLILDGIFKNGMDIRGAKYEPGEFGKVCYLSIHESWVQDHMSQRRPGLHTESPGKIYLIEERKYQEGELGDGPNMNKSAQKNSKESQGDGTSANYKGIHRWGFSKGYLKGGIYLASTVINSCKLWDCQIIPDEAEGRDIIGKFGDIEHLRKYIGPGEVMEEDLMYWITDLTPHESLPLETRTYRQWFRLVTSRVSLWFQDHSTPNPLGIVPDPKITKIVKGSKFEEASLVIVSTKNDSSNKDL